MAEETKIQWCDHTFNPWIGCAKVSPGCANCYAEVSTPSRAFGVKWGRGQPRKRTSEGNWKEPIRWNKTMICGCCGGAFGGEQAFLHRHGTVIPAMRRPRVFCASLADWLDDEVPIEWLADLLKLIHDTPNLDWLLLTKRPENWLKRLTAVWDEFHWEDYPGVEHEGSVTRFLRRWLSGEPPANVWVGTTVEDQQRAEERIPELLKIPARVRFLSVEPLLGAVDLSAVKWNAGNGYFGDCFGADHIPNGRADDASRIHWVIVGGESGAKARPCNVDWIRGVVRQCRAAGVACFVKQLGARPILRMAPEPTYPPRRREFIDFGDRLELKHPKGGELDEWPEDLQVREFPGVEQKATEGAKA